MALNGLGYEMNVKYSFNKSLTIFMLGIESINCLASYINFYGCKSD